MLAPSEIQAVGFETSHLICIERIGIFEYVHKEAIT